MSSIEVKTEKFKQDFAPKLGFTQDEVKIDNTRQTKVQLYYFNVDLKFVLKARMHMLKQTFEEKNFKTSAAVGLKFQCG